MDAKWAMGALLLALGAGCGEMESIDAAPDETDADSRQTEAPVPPDREPERTGCEPLPYEMHDGSVIYIPVECQMELIDRGDPPNENPIQKEKEIVENPAEQHQEV
jgi:hypothetical protein